MRLEVHTGLEPWHVLGAETTAQGTSRYVDSSVERLQVLVRGLHGDRYTVTCNQRPLPLQPTGERGSAVAGTIFDIVGSKSGGSGDSGGGLIGASLASECDRAGTSESLHLLLDMPERWALNSAVF